MRTFEKIDPTELSLAPFAAISQGWQLVCGVKPDGTYNALTASWGALGTLWGMPVALCFIRSSRYTKEFIDAGDKITFSLFSPDEHRDELMVMGRTSGRDCDKIAKAGLTVATADGLPYFDAADAVLLGTKVFAQELDGDGFTAAGQELKLYDKNYVQNTDGMHTLYVARIDEVLVAEED